MKIITLLLSLTALCEAVLPEPYNSVKDLPFDDHGWFCNQDQISVCLNSQPIHTVIEVGCWLGMSTRFIARNLPQDGILYAVDHWLGSPEERVHMTDPRLPQLYQTFLSNVKQAGLCKKIIPIRMESKEASEALDILADLIYLDASHDTESVYNDIILWRPHLKEGGILCGDDWWWDTVKIAVRKAAADFNYDIEASGNFWRLIPKND